MVLLNALALIALSANEVELVGGRQPRRNKATGPLMDCNVLIKSPVPVNERKGCQWKRSTDFGCRTAKLATPAAPSSNLNDAKSRSMPHNRNLFNRWLHCLGNLY